MNVVISAEVRCKCQRKIFQKFGDTGLEKESIHFEKVSGNEQLYREWYISTMYDKAPEKRSVFDAEAAALIQTSLHAFDDEKGMMSCGKCGSSNVVWNQRQLRRADEAATVFCTCSDCNERWKM